MSKETLRLEIEKLQLHKEVSEKKHSNRMQELEKRESIAKISKGYRQHHFNRLHNKTYVMIKELERRVKKLENNDTKQKNFKEDKQDNVNLDTEGDRREK